MELGFYAVRGMISDEWIGVVVMGMDAGGLGVVGEGRRGKSLRGGRGV